jgi:hypothetical protein
LFALKLATFVAHTEARKEARRRFGRSDRRAQRNPSNASLDQTARAVSLALCLVDNAGEASPAWWCRIVTDPR